MIHKFRTASHSTSTVKEYRQIGDGIHAAGRLRNHTGLTVGARPARLLEPCPSSFPLSRHHVANSTVMKLPARLLAGHARHVPAISVLEAAVGGKAAATALLRQLDAAGHVRTTGTAAGQRYVTKIQVGSKRQLVVKIDESGIVRSNSRVVR